MAGEGLDEKIDALEELLVEARERIKELESKTPGGGGEEVKTLRADVAKLTEQITALAAKLDIKPKARVL